MGEAVMKKDIADKWVAALRSGKYRQATGALHDNGGYCCLGVLCDISGAGMWVNDLYQIGDGNTDEFTGLSYLPEALRIQTGMRSDNGSFRVRPDNDPLGHGFLTSLANLNDDGKSFAEIANVIEREWENL
jgi:hypothetical protein